MILCLVNESSTPGANTRVRVDIDLFIETKRDVSVDSGVGGSGAWMTTGDASEMISFAGAKVGSCLFGIQKKKWKPALSRKHSRENGTGTSTDIRRLRCGPGERAGEDDKGSRKLIKPAYTLGNHVLHNPDPGLHNCVLICQYNTQV